MDGLTGGSQYLAAGAGDSPPHGGAGLARILVHLALGVGAEVVPIHLIAHAVAHGPGAGQHRLDGQGRRWGAGPDFMGHHPL
jgi:hypothetical protein